VNEKAKGSEIIQSHAIVKGRVQGVGFRGTTQHHARRLQLTGTVKNLPDGTVEIYALGTHEQIQELFEALRNDPGMGRVEGISLDETPPRKEFEDFQIIF
jgi:acylphosphatase